MNLSTQITGYTLNTVETKNSHIKSAPVTLTYIGNHKGKIFHKKISKKLYIRFNNLEKVNMQNECVRLK